MGWADQIPANPVNNMRKVNSENGYEKENKTRSSEAD